MELNIGVACYCMPAARVVIRRHFPNCGFGTTHHDTAEYDQNSEAIGRKGTHGTKLKDLSGGSSASRSGAPIAKMPRGSSRRLTRDSSSDQMELYPQSERPQ
jgi:hypothetical protein